MLELLVFNGEFSFLSVNFIYVRCKVNLFWNIWIYEVNVVCVMKIYILILFNLMEEDKILKDVYFFNYCKLMFCLLIKFLLKIFCFCF